MTDALILLYKKYKRLQFLKLIVSMTVLAFFLGVLPGFLFFCAFKYNWSWWVLLISLLGEYLILMLLSLSYYLLTAMRYKLSKLSIQQDISRYNALLGFIIKRIS